MSAPHAPHIVVDARMVAHSGIGTYIRHIVPRLADHRPSWQWTLLGDVEALQALDWSDDANVRFVKCLAPIYSMREQMELAMNAPRGATLFWSPHYNIPLAYTGRIMVTLHDIGHLTLRELFSGVERAYARTMFGAVRLRARAIVCDSAFTRGEYLRLVGAGVAEPCVVHLGIDEVWSAPPTGPVPHPRPYIVCVGVIKAHKNIGTLVRAFAKIKDEVPHDLIVIGRRSGLRNVDEDAIRAAADVGGRVHFAGEVPFDQLRSLVAHATALVSTSLHEGFGLPPLEAMAAGVPCLVSNVTALPEVCGDAALYCNPRDVDDVAAKLRELLSDSGLRATLKQRGLRRAATFTWERCAAETAAVMEGAMN